MKYLLNTIVIAAATAFAVTASAQVTESPVPPPDALLPAQVAPSMPPSAAPAAQPRRTVRQKRVGSTTHRYDPRDHVANQLNAQQSGQSMAEAGYPGMGYPGAGYGGMGYGGAGYGGMGYGGAGYGDAGYGGMGNAGMGYRGMGYGGGGGAGRGGGGAILAACGSDIQRLCAGVQPGEGRIRQCMRARMQEVSPQCINAAMAARGGAR